jgi:hypothetical protein
MLEPGDAHVNAATRAPSVPAIQAAGRRPTCRVSTMAYAVTVGIVGAWLPQWELPVGAQGFDMPYADRLKVELLDG